MSFPYTRLVLLISFLIGGSVLFFLHVRSIVWTPIGAVLIGIPLSLYLNVWATRFKPAVFKKWKSREPRKPRRRTFFEWLYKRDQIRAPEISEKGKEDR
jgi:hypothetical protein